MVGEHAVDVARRVAGGQDHRAAELLPRAGGDTRHLVVVDEQPVHAGAEVHFAAAARDVAAHAFNHAGQLVRADVRVSVVEDSGVGAVLAEADEDTLHRAAFLTAGVEFAVGEGARATLAEAVVRLRVDRAAADDVGDVTFAFVHLAATLHDDGAYAQLDESEGGEESAGSGADHDGSGSAGDVTQFDVGEERFGRLLVEEGAEGDIDVDRALSGVDRSFKDAQGTRCVARLALYDGAQCVVIGRLFGQQSELKVFGHGVGLCLIIVYFFSGDSIVRRTSNPTRS